MAKIETTFIRPKEVFNVETGEAKVVYDGYQNNPHELVVEENLKGEVDGIINDTFIEDDNNNVTFKDKDGNEHELITSEGFGDALNEALPSALANAQVIKTTWSELKALRDGGNLIAGSLYRITDYNCTTTQENTRSAGHQFDIVLLALSANKLAEEGWAMMNESNIYDVTFSDGVAKKCWVYDINGHSYDIVDVETLLGVRKAPITLDEENKTGITEAPSAALMTPNLSYNYFQNSNLSAWKVWYCLDNDTARFAWAMGGDEPSIDVEGDVFVRNPQGDIEGLYCWTLNNDNAYTKTPFPNKGDFTYDEEGNFYGRIVDVTGFGRGVIYRLIDEFMNDVCYDFKNIQFVRPLTDGAYDPDTGTDTWCYTFNGWDSDNSISFDTSIIFDVDNGYITENNKIKNVEGTVVPESISNWALSNNVVLLGGSSTYIIGSINCTSIGGVKLIHCSEIVVNTSTMFLYCQNETFDLDDPAIYINNKKVLTET